MPHGVGPRLAGRRAARRCRASTSRSSCSSSATTPRSRRSWRALGPAAPTTSAPTTKGVTFDLPEPVDYLRAKNGIVRGGVGATAGRGWTATPTCARRSWRCRGPRTGISPSRGSARWSSGPGPRLADLAAEHEGKQITFADTQARPTPVHHLAGVVRLGDRRPAVLGVRHQRRAGQAVAHPDRAAALLPRPRLDGRARRAAAGLPAAAGHARGCSASRGIGDDRRARGRRCGT